jgi:hypothetical protein
MKRGQEMSREAAAFVRGAGPMKHMLDTILPVNEVQPQPVPPGYGISTSATAETAAIVSP